MLSNSYIKVSYRFTIIGFITEPTLKIINDTRYNFVWNASFRKKKKAFANLFRLLNTICHLEQLIIRLKDFINLVLVCNGNGSR